MNHIGYTKENSGDKQGYSNVPAYAVVKKKKNTSVVNVPENSSTEEHGYEIPQTSNFENNNSESTYVNLNNLYSNTTSGVATTTKRKETRKHYNTPGDTFLFTDKLRGIYNMIGHALREKLYSTKQKEFANKTPSERKTNIAQFVSQKKQKKQTQKQQYLAEKQTRKQQYLAEKKNKKILKKKAAIKIRDDQCLDLKTFIEINKDYLINFSETITFYEKNFNNVNTELTSLNKDIRKPEHTSADIKSFNDILERLKESRNTLINEFNTFISDLSINEELKKIKNCISDFQILPDTSDDQGIQILISNFNQLFTMAETYYKKTKLKISELIKSHEKMISEMEKKLTKKIMENERLKKAREQLSIKSDLNYQKQMKYAEKKIHERTKLCIGDNYVLTQLENLQKKLTETSQYFDDVFKYCEENYKIFNETEDNKMLLHQYKSIFYSVQNQKMMKILSIDQQERILSQYETINSLINKKNELQENLNRLQYEFEFEFKAIDQQLENIQYCYDAFKNLPDKDNFTELRVDISKRKKELLTFYSNLKIEYRQNFTKIQNFIKSSKILKTLNKIEKNTVKKPIKRSARTKRYTENFNKKTRLAHTELLREQTIIAMKTQDIEYKEEEIKKLNQNLKDLFAKYMNEKTSNNAINFNKDKTARKTLIENIKNLVSEVEDLVKKNPILKFPEMIQNSNENKYDVTFNENKYDVTFNESNSNIDQAKFNEAMEHGIDHRLEQSGEVETNQSGEVENSSNMGSLELKSVEYPNVLESEVVNSVYPSSTGTTAKTIGRPRTSRASHA
jgi:hypothetical protein